MHRDTTGTWDKSHTNISAFTFAPKAFYLALFLAPMALSFGHKLRLKRIPHFRFHLGLPLTGKLTFYSQAI